MPMYPPTYLTIVWMSRVMNATVKGGVSTASVSKMLEQVHGLFGSGAGAPKNLPRLFRNVIAFAGIVAMANEGYASMNKPIAPKPQSRGPKFWL